MWYSSHTELKIERGHVDMIRCFLTHLNGFFVFQFVACVVYMCFSVELCVFVRMALNATYKDRKKKIPNTTEVRMLSLTCSLFAQVASEEQPGSPSLQKESS